MRDRPNVLFRTYESMRKDLPAAVREIAAFMGVELTPAQFEAVIHKAGFQYMQQISECFEPGLLTPFVKPGRYMVRRGACGESAELLTSAQQRRIDDECRAELKRLGCDFPYDAYYLRSAARSNSLSRSGSTGLVK